MLWTWINKYQNEGEDGLIPKNKTGNHFASLHASKSLSELELLKLILLKQEINWLDLFGRPCS